MGTAVDICNAALAELGESYTITAISPPDGSVYARHCSRLYTPCRDEVLADHAWGFATKRALLADSADDPPASWAFAYALPADFIRPVSVYPETTSNDESDAQDYTIEGQNLYTNVEKATLRYVFRVEDATKYPPYFARAVSKKIAQLLCGPLAKDVKLRQVLGTEYLQVLAHAAALDSSAQRTTSTYKPAWISDR